MKIGVSTASLFSRKNNEDALPYLNELGVEYAEVFLTSFPNIRKNLVNCWRKERAECRYIPCTF